MKIPETSANVGAYYGNEENGQWQPNGVMIDNGVGGGVVGSGDAGMHRPPVYPVHIPRGHVPAGYVVAGAYYGPPYAAVPPPQPDDFSDYMWMENEEEFDKQVLQQLEEEALMEQCIEAMLEDEQRERRANRGNRHDYPTTSNGNLRVSLEEAVSRSTLNPLAAEFVPTRGRQPSAPPTASPTTAPTTSTASPTVAQITTQISTQIVPPTSTTSTEERAESTPPATQTEAPSPKEEQSRTEADSTEDKESRTEADSTEDKESRTEVKEETRTEEPLTPPKDPPEVSALDVHTKIPPKKDPRKQPEPKKQTKVEPKKKPLPIVVKSETKVQPKKRDVKEVKAVKSEVKAVKSEVKTVKSEVKVEEKSEEIAIDLPKPQIPITEEVPSTPSFKPINYAAAAKASKPKPKSTTPPIEKPTQPIQPIRTEKKIDAVKEKPKTEKIEKKILPKEKSLPKDKVNMQRKNSTK